MGWTPATPAGPMLKSGWQDTGLPAGAGPACRIKTGTWLLRGSQVSGRTIHRWMNQEKIKQGERWWHSQTFGGAEKGKTGDGLLFQFSRGSRPQPRSLNSTQCCLGAQCVSCLWLPIIFHFSSKIFFDLFLFLTTLPFLGQENFFIKEQFKVAVSFFKSLVSRRRPLFFVTL